MREYLQRVYNSVLAHPGLAALGSGIPDLLVKQAQATVMMHRYIIILIFLYIFQLLIL